MLTTSVVVAFLVGFILAGIIGGGTFGIRSFKSASRLRINPELPRRTELLKQLEADDLDPEDYGQGTQPVWVIPVSQLRMFDAAGNYPIPDEIIDDRQFVTMTNISFVLSPPEWWENQISRIETVPRGIETDFASIPKPVRRWVGEPTGPVSTAAIVHDWAYRYSDCFGRSQDAREHWDKLFLRLLLEDQVKRSWVIYGAVRGFGRKAWRNGSQSLTDEEVRRARSNLSALVEKVVTRFVRVEVLARESAAPANDEEVDQEAAPESDPARSEQV